MTTQELAREGEDTAAAFLTKKGYTVHTRNFHFSRNGEIDIVAAKNGVTVFVEVKRAATAVQKMPCFRSRQLHAEIHFITNGDI